MAQHARVFVDAVLASDRNFVVIYPNNDEGARYLLAEYEPFAGNPRFRVFPSVDFEKFLTLLKHSKCVVGNSSAGVREAPFYGLPSVNVGNRQSNRYQGATVSNSGYDSEEIQEAIRRAWTQPRGEPDHYFGSGNSAERFIDLLGQESLWKTSRQKLFNDI